ncbi:MAG: hypothetical protein LBC61_02255, partial [Candidatus Peribacteria bacterium]|nr:hypothetical protein [Candidatus Peribacteria bacterium]
NQFSISIQKSFIGRSLMCHIEATTLKSFIFKNFSIVFHFAGDSTITKFLAINKKYVKKYSYLFNLFCFYVKRK